MKKKIKPICFYLPQFHQIPENDRWWGEGFTEWSLVRDARPLFEGHQHPVVPDEKMGYYDASELETRRRQAELARQYGIYGFCYYHYWFNGKRLLEKPLENMLQDGQPDLPFCLCWANEPWSRRWSGEEQEVLQHQVYGEQEDWENHFEELYRFFEHPNYICVDGCPVFLIYRIGHIPHAKQMIAHWRALAASRGLPGLHIVAIEGGFPDSRVAPDFVDAAAEHQPSRALADSRPLVMNGLHVYSAEEVWEKNLSRPGTHAVHYPGVCHAWDNTPRRGREGRVVLPFRVERFRHHLDTLFKEVKASARESFVFVNAWNEWSEGAHLEPEQTYGDSWLACIRDALERPAERPQVPQGRMYDVEPITLPRNRFKERKQVQPDIDLINTIVLHQVQAARVIEFGCGQGVTGEHISSFVGADRYIGLEPNLEWVEQARNRLDEVYQIDPGVSDLRPLGVGTADFVVSGELLSHVSEPVLALSHLRELLSADGVACLCFENAGSYENIHRYSSCAVSPEEVRVSDCLARSFSLNQVKKLLIAAGFRVEKIYRVFSPELARIKDVQEHGNSARFGYVRMENLGRKHLEDLFCLRFLVFVKRDTFSSLPVDAGSSRGPVEKERDDNADREVSYERFQHRINRTTSPNDDLYRVYRHNNSAQDYFKSAFRQIGELDTLLLNHCHRRFTELDSIGDYACHYGRLLRAMRAVLPKAELCAYDIDPGVTTFCEQQLACEPVIVDWNTPPGSLEPRHQLLTCASLLTHTDHDFYRRVLAMWERLLLPGGLLCFTYLGESYIPRWLNGELEHYGAIDPDIREQAAKVFAEKGHAMAGFDTPYSDSGAYGVGFMKESVVIAELAHYPQLEYLGSVPGDQSQFNQNLAVVRKVNN